MVCFEISHTCVHACSIAPPLVIFIVANHVKLDIEALQHHVHREGLGL